MQKAKTILSSVRTITTLVTKCSAIPTPTSSLQLDSYLEPEPHDDVYLQNRKLDGMIQCGNLKLALKMFEEMPIRDVVTYNMLISEFGRRGMSEQALGLYAELNLRGLRESASTFSSVLGICCDSGFYREGTQLHCRVIALGFTLNLYVGSSIVGLYLQMGLVDVSLKLFDELQERSSSTWNLILRGICEVGELGQLIKLYSKMKSAREQPNGLTFCYLIRGCGIQRSLEEGKQFHCQAVKAGWIESNIFLKNALVDFYSSCASLIDTRKSFEAIPLNDVISWNSIVAVYAENGLILEILDLFSLMQFYGKRPSIRSFVGLLNFCSRSENIHLGRQIHSRVLKQGSDLGSVYIHCALIDMYGKCGDIQSSVAVYEEDVFPRTSESCNSLMASLLHCGAAEDVVNMFGLMVDIRIDEVSISLALKALSSPSLAGMASFQLLHCYALKTGFGANTILSCCLVDGYSKCGHVELSRKVFEELPRPNAVCFTSVINGYAHNGKGKEGLEMFHKMVEKGLVPDKVTFLCALKGCNHSGLVEEGRFLFELMKNHYKIRPDQQHCSSMIDLLGRAGFLDEAEELLQQTPENGDSVNLSLLLRSCRVHGNEIVGRRVAKAITDLEPDNPEILLQASTFYCEIGDFQTALWVRELAVAKKVRKEIGQSKIELKTVLKAMPALSCMI